MFLFLHYLIPSIDSAIIIVFIGVYIHIFCKSVFYQKLNQYLSIRKIVCLWLNLSELEATYLYNYQIKITKK